MQHAYMYHGGFELNYPGLARGANSYRTDDLAEHEIPSWPAEADGVRIGYMEKRGGRFFAVRVQFEDHDVVLSTPVVIDQIRHMGNGRFSVAPTMVGDDFASELLDDIIARNRNREVELALLINRVNQVRRAARG